jgi:hypothetical protein
MLTVANVVVRYKRTRVPCSWRAGWACDGLRRLTTPMQQLVADKPLLSSRAACGGSVARLSAFTRTRRTQHAAFAPQAQAAAGDASEQRRVVAITGATGFVGTALVRRLQASGARVRVLTRDVPKARRTLPAVPIADFFDEAKWGRGIAGASAVVNLAGEPISKGRWNADVKRLIKASRLGATTRVVSALSACAPEERPGVLVSASAVGFYGTSSSSVSFPYSLSRPACAC